MYMRVLPADFVPPCLPTKDAGWRSQSRGGSRALFPHYRAVLGARADTSFECLSLCVSLASENSVCRSETAVPPKCANETRALRPRQMSRKFVSARKPSLLDSRKVPGLTEEFAKQKGQKLEIRQLFNSWRGWKDSNLQPDGYEGTSPAASRPAAATESPTACRSLPTAGGRKDQSRGPRGGRRPCRAGWQAGGQYHARPRGCGRG
jgi:hypothetical protein